MLIFDEATQRVMSSTGSAVWGGHVTQRWRLLSRSLDFLEELRSWWSWWSWWSRASRPCLEPDLLCLWSLDLERERDRDLDLERWRPDLRSRRPSSPSWKRRAAGKSSARGPGGTVASREESFVMSQRALLATAKHWPRQEVVNTGLKM